MSAPDDDTPSPLPAFTTRVWPPEDPPFEERHPVLALLNLLLRLPPVLLLILLWLLLLGLIRPLEWLHASARRQPLTAAPLSEALRTRFGDWILRLF